MFVLPFVNKLPPLIAPAGLAIVLCIIIHLPGESMGILQNIQERKCV